MADNDQSINNLRYNQVTQGLEGFGGGSPMWTPLILTADGGINQLTGDATAGPGSGSQSLTLATVNSNVGSFTSANITVDAKGRITAATNGSGATPAGANTQIQYNNSGAFGASANLTFDGTSLHVSTKASINSSTGVTTLDSGAIFTSGNGVLTLLDLTATDEISLPNQTPVAFGESSGSGTNSVNVQGPTTIGTSYNLFLPSAQGGASTFLQNDGAGHLSWVSPPATSPAGADTQVQYNSSGIFGASPNFTFDGSTLTAPDMSVTSGLILQNNSPAIFQDLTSGNQISISAPNGISATYSLSLPTTQGAASTFLQNDGAGHLSWASAGGSSPTPSVQFRSSASFNTTSTSFVASGTKIMGFALSNSSHKVSISVVGDGNIPSASDYMYLTIFRDAVNLGDASVGLCVYAPNGAGVEVPVAMIYLDAPGDTSAHTYEVYIRSGAGGQVDFPSTTTLNTMIVQEIV